MSDNKKMDNPPILEILTELSIESKEPEALVVGNLQKIAIEENFTEFKNINAIKLSKGSENGIQDASDLIWMTCKHSKDSRINFLFGPRQIAFNCAKSPDDKNDIKEDVNKIFLKLLEKVSKENAIKIDFKTLRYKVLNAYNGDTFFKKSIFKVTAGNKDFIEEEKIQTIGYKEIDSDDITKRITIASPAILYSDTYKKTVKTTIVDILMEANIKENKEVCEKIKKMYKKNSDTFFSLFKNEKV